MPVIGGADENGVNVFVFEQFPEIGIDLTGGTHRSPSLFGVGFIDIAKGDEVSIGGLSHEVAHVLAASSAADQADADSFIGAINSGGTGGGDGKEISTIHGEYYIESPPPRAGRQPFATVCAERASRVSGRSATPVNFVVLEQTTAGTVGGRGGNRGPTDVCGLGAGCGGGARIVRGGCERYRFGGSQLSNRAERFCPFALGNGEQRTEMVTAGAEGGLACLDQVNVLLSRTLSGRLTELSPTR